MAVKDQEMNIDRYGDIAASPTHTLDLQATPRYPNCLECYNGKCKIWNHFITKDVPIEDSELLSFVKNPFAAVNQKLRYYQSVYFVY